MCAQCWRLGVHAGRVVACGEGLAGIGHVELPDGPWTLDRIGDSRDSRDDDSHTAVAVTAGAITYGSLPAKVLFEDVRKVTPAAAPAAGLGVFSAGYVSLGNPARGGGIPTYRQSYLVKDVTKVYYLVSPPAEDTYIPPTGVTQSYLPR